MQSSSQAHNLGYVFYPARRPHAVGHPRLDIFLRTIPTRLHFDPERVEIPALLPAGNVEMLLLYHPWPGTQSYRVYPGRLIVRDRVNKEVEAFTFGGQLEIKTGEDFTVCTVTSEAPILDLGLGQSVAEMLAEEVEILFAEQRAAWGRNLDALEQRLAEIDPLTLYLACTHSLRERFRHYPAGEDELIRHFQHLLNTERQQFEEIHPLPAQAATLEELLAP